MKRTILTLIGIAAIALLAVGCGEETGVSPTPTATIGLAVAFDMTPPNVTEPGGDVQTNSKPVTAPDSVTVTAGLLMVRSVRLNQSIASSVDTVITAADENRDLGDAAVRFQGPYVVSLNESSYNFGTTTIPEDEYRQLTFVLQKARSTDDLNGYDELIGSSLSVSGKVWRDGNWQRFGFETDYTSEIAITGDFAIDASVRGTLTVEFAPLRWFHNGSTWMDPNDTGNRVRILNNIRRNVSGSLDRSN